MLNDQQRLMLIQDSIDEIEKLSSMGKHLFEDDPQIQHSMLEALREIGRASSSFTPKIKRRYPDANWEKIDSMSSFLGGPDLTPDPEIIWLSVEQDVPTIKREIRMIVQTVETIA